MREEVVSLRQEKKALQYNMCLLEEDNQILREEIQHLRGKILRCFFRVQGNMVIFFKQFSIS